MNENLILDGRHQAQAALRVAETRLKHPRRPAALIGSRDAMALSILQAAGVEVDMAEERALGGIDDIEIAARHHIQLTTLSRHAAQGADGGARGDVLEIVDDAARFAREPFQHVVRATLMVRRACGAAG